MDEERVVVGNQTKPPVPLHVKMVDETGQMGVAGFATIVHGWALALKNTRKELRKKNARKKCFIQVNMVVCQMYNKTVKEQCQLRRIKITC